MGVRIFSFSLLKSLRCFPKTNNVFEAFKSMRIYRKNLEMCLKKTTFLFLTLQTKSGRMRFLFKDVQSDLL